MGSSLSGRRGPRNRKPTTDEYPALDVRQLYRNGTLRPGASRSYAWDRDGIRLTRVTVHADEGLLRVTTDDGWAEWVEIDHTPCNYGGSRPWFRCPGDGCGGRVAILYVSDDGLLCRDCLGITYAVCNESEDMRLLRKAQRLRSLLERSDLYRLFALKPGGMHWTTFHRLRRDADTAEIQAMRLIAGDFGNLLNAIS